jgi:hypothetical protein
MPKNWESQLASSTSSNSTESVREVEITRELSRADSISRETGSMLDILEKRLTPVLRQEPESKDGGSPVPPPQTTLGQMLSDVSASGVRNIARIQSILLRLEL